MQFIFTPYFLYTSRYQTLVSRRQGTLDNFVLELELLENELLQDLVCYERRTGGTRLALQGDCSIRYSARRVLG